MFEFLWPVAPYAALVIGLAILIKGADLLVDGSSSLAKKWGISSAIIGLTIVAFGTSMPELLVNIISALKGNADIAFGNVMGSNIANILLILGVTGLFATLKVQKATVYKEIPFALLAAAALFVLGNTSFLDGTATNILTRSGGLILLLFFAVFLYYAIESGMKTEDSDSDDSVVLMPSRKAVGFIVVGLAGLYFWGSWTVDWATIIAKQLGMSDLMIGVTIVAIGTSLPELVTSIVAARKNDVDMAIGNIVGSNIFNIFWILGVTAVITPMPFPANALYDFVALFVATGLLFAFMFMGRRHELSKWQCILFLFLYVAYIVAVVMRG